MVVTHLEEFSRPPQSRWLELHYRLVQDWFGRHAPERELACCRMGESVVL
jgi:hypothetical protein